MTEYISIKPEVLRLLEENYTIIRERFGIETIGIFGSVSRGEDTAESDVDILISFQKGRATFVNLVSLGDFLEELFSRPVDLITHDGMSKYMCPYIEQEVIAVEA